MSNDSLSLTFSAEVQDSQNDWARIIQKVAPGNSASLGDLAQMQALAVTGVSAREYMADCCPSAKIIRDYLVISIDIYVYLNRLDLPYSISIDWGKISTKLLYKEPTAFPVIFDNSQEVTFASVFEGAITAETPFFRQDGGKIMDILLKIMPTTIRLGEPATAVMRAVGKLVGYKHTVTMKIENKSGYRISSLHNTATLTYNNNNNKGVVSQKLEIIFPKCVLDLLDTCSDGSFKVSAPKDVVNKYINKVYYSTCNGNVVLIRNEQVNQ